MDEFVLHVALIFLPGLLWAKIDANYAARRKPNQFTFLTNAFFFGLSAHLIVFIGYWLCDARFTVPFQSVDMTNFSIYWFADEIVWSIPASFIGAVIWCFSVRRRWLMKLLHCIGATNAFGDEDVWEFAFNSDDTESRFVNIRDRDTKIVYSGWVYSFSGSDQKRELVLLDVIVYDDITGEQLYEMPRVYLEYTDKWKSVEFPTGLKENEDT